MVTHPQCARGRTFRPRKAVTISASPAGLPVVAEGGPYLELLTAE